MDNDKKRKFLVYIAFISVIAGLSYFILKFCIAYLLPFIIGAVIAFSVQTPAVYISERTGIKRGTASLLLVIFLYILLLAIVFFIVNKIYNFAIGFTQTAPNFLSKISYFATNFSKEIDNLAKKISGNSGNFLSDTLSGVLQSSAVKISETISSFLKNFVTALPGVILSIFAAVITGCYIAKDIDSLKENLHFALKPRYISALKNVWHIISNNVFKLAKGYIILATLTFLQLSAGFLILKVDNAFRVAFLTAIVDLLPVFGCGTVLIPWAVISAIIGKPVFCVGLLILYLFITAIRNIAEPKIIGKQVGLHPLITLIAMFLGLKIFGFYGLIFVPLIVTVAYKVTEQKATA